MYSAGDKLILFGNSNKCAPAGTRQIPTETIAKTLSSSRTTLVEVRCSDHSWCGLQAGPGLLVGGWSLKAWLGEQLAKLSKGSALAEAIRYGPNADVAGSADACVAYAASPIAKTTVQRPMRAVAISVKRLRIWMHCSMAVMQGGPHEFHPQTRAEKRGC